MKKRAMAQLFPAGAVSAAFGAAGLAALVAAFLAGAFLAAFFAAGAVPAGSLSGFGRFLRSLFRSHNSMEVEFGFSTPGARGKIIAYSGDCQHVRQEYSPPMADGCKIHTEGRPRIWLLMH